MPLTEHQAFRRQILLGLGAGLACWALLSAAHVSGAFNTIDLRLLDWRFQLRRERPAADAIALVTVDDETIRAYGGWPLPRDQYALLIEALEDAGALAIGVDLQLPEDANHDPQHNALLAFVSAEHPNVVHAVSFMAEAPGRGGAPAISAAATEALHRQGAVDVESAVPEAAGVLLPFGELVERAAALGHITVAADRDGAIRRQPQLVRYEDRVYPSLALRMVGIGAGHTGSPRARPERGGLRVAWDRGSGWWLPIDREGATSLDFAGDRRAFPHSRSMIGVLQAYQAGQRAQLRESFARRLVLIGLDSRSEVSEDVGTTPFAATTPLLFVHANAIDNLLRGRFLRQPPLWAYLGTLAVAAMALGGWLAVLPMVAAALVATAGVLLIAGLDCALLAVAAIDVPPMATLLLAPAVYAAVMSGRYLFLESRSRQREVEIREGRSVEQQFLPEALIGHDLSRYRVVEKLGSGAMGIVYRAHDPRLGRDVAIKVLPARALADESTRRRFRREALLLSKLNHPHVAGIFDFDSQDGTDFLVMEYASGRPLTERLRQGALPEPEVLRITSQIAEALDEAHRRGVVHRDLKPDNVMLVGPADVKVLDFGVAMFLHDEGESATRVQTLTEAGHMLGTLSYMAPEVMCGNRAEPRSDLYSLGVMTFEMATGRRPFPNDEPHELMYTVLNQAPPEPRILNARISERLDAIILKLLAKDPKDRFASAQELLEALRTVDRIVSHRAAAAESADRGGTHA